MRKWSEKLGNKFANRKRERESRKKQYSPSCLWRKRENERWIEKREKETILCLFIIKERQCSTKQIKLIHVRRKRKLKKCVL